jgi:1-acyl-sn-glycerol-3-phosphate acyltransferase
LWLLYYVAPCFVAKGAVAHWPIVGSIATAFQTVFVEREAQASRSQTLDKIKDRYCISCQFAESLKSKEHWKKVGHRLPYFQVFFSLFGNLIPI